MSIKLSDSDKFSPTFNYSELIRDWNWYYYYFVSSENRVGRACRTTN